MHHVVLERWSRGTSFLHRRDPRAKCLALLVLLLAIATATKAPAITALIYLFVLLGATASARLPVGAVAVRAAAVLPFSGVFAVITWFAGDPGHAVALVAKSYVSAFAVLLTVSTTPLPELLRGLELLRIPRFLLMVAQFLYRYLFVISEEAQHMRAAATSRGATTGGILSSRERFRAAAGALGVLFSRSYGRAEQIHRAMLARGFDGQFHTAWPLQFGWSDAVLLAQGILVAAAGRLAVEGWL